jgi:hypothetical protein
VVARRQEARVDPFAAVKAFRNGHVVDEFVGAFPPQLVAQSSTGSRGPVEAQQLLEQLRIEGEWPDVVAAIDAGELDHAVELLLERLASADGRARGRGA